MSLSKFQESRNNYNRKEHLFTQHLFWEGDFVQVINPGVANTEEKIIQR